MNLTNSVRNVVEKMLVQHPCDCWTVAAFVTALQPSDMIEVTVIHVLLYLFVLDKHPSAPVGRQEEVAPNQSQLPSHRAVRHYAYAKQGHGDRTMC